MILELPLERIIDRAYIWPLVAYFFCRRCILVTFGMWRGLLRYTIKWNVK